MRSFGVVWHTLYPPLYAGAPHYTAVSVQAYLQHDAEPDEGGDSQVSQQEQRVCVWRHFLHAKCMKCRQSPSPFHQSGM